jgi:hypothetical protein
MKEEAAVTEIRITETLNHSKKRMIRMSGNI